MDPIHQFQINNLFPIARIGGAEIAFTNSTVFMLLSLAIILLFMVGGTSRRALVAVSASRTARSSSWSGRYNGTLVSGCMLVPPWDYGRPGVSDPPAGRFD